MRRTITILTLAAVLTSGVARATPVTADSLLLIVNKRQPIGRQLAEHYAELRHVPTDRIVEIDVPERDDVPVEVYDAAIAQTVRDAIDQRHLRLTVNCLVTFYGVPLRVLDHAITPAERIERTDVIEPMIGPLREQMVKTVTAIEALAHDADAKYKPLGVPLDVADAIRSRGVDAERAISAALIKEPDAARRDSIVTRLHEVQRGLMQMPAISHLGTPPPATAPADPHLADWLAHPENAQARHDARMAIFAQGNVFGLLQLLESQRNYLTPGEGEASVDSELACLYLPPSYPRTRWLPNPFHYSGSNAQLLPLMIRTARIDAPTPEIARRIIDESVAVEAVGLRGDAVVDARGLPDSGGVTGSYDGYDRSLDRLGTLLGNAAELTPIVDAKDALLPDHTSGHAAIYAGWYKVRHYAPTVRCVPGAVAFHIASLEMMSLHAPGETGWCRGLLLDGRADATMGAVGEPYLFAFPPADEFVGLLLTGKPTLVDAYWSTILCTSWKLVLIGDPLYRPFAAHPAIAVEKLPAGLQHAAQ